MFDLQPHPVIGKAPAALVACQMDLATKGAPLVMWMGWVSLGTSAVPDILRLNCALLRLNLPEVPTACQKDIRVSYT